MGFILDLNQPIPDLGKFDLILGLDVLEHLVQPWDVPSRLVDHLTKEGSVIVSVTNVSRLSISGPLIALNRFRYTENGIINRTHLRFFKPETAIEPMTQADLHQRRAGSRTGPSATTTTRSA